MQLLTDFRGDVAVLHITGSMDAETVSDFDAEWKRLFEEGVSRLVVELSGVEYISSAGLRGILLLAKTAQGAHAKIAFAGLTGMVADMFKLSGFLTILSTHPDLEAALAAV